MTASPSVDSPPTLHSPVSQVLQADGVTIETAKAVSVKAGAGGSGHALTLSTGTVVEGDTLLVAVGRKPVTSGLDLDKIGVKLGAKGGIQVRIRCSQSLVFERAAVHHDFGLCAPVAGWRELGFVGARTRCACAALRPMGECFSRVFFLCAAPARGFCIFGLGFQVRSLPRWLARISFSRVWSLQRSARQGGRGEAEGGHGSVAASMSAIVGLPIFSHRGSHRRGCCDTKAARAHCWSKLRQSRGSCHAPPPRLSTHGAAPSPHNRLPRIDVEPLPLL